MRLLDTNTLTLKSFEGDERPSYAILSHTWGDDEVTFDDINPERGTIEDLELQRKSGYQKISLACEQARKHKFKWIWIDTCCIDKNSSSELSEAINSMFKWYHSARVCYVYLEDVFSGDVQTLGGYGANRAILQSARWFGRGWVLQELLAPDAVYFYCVSPHAAHWHFLGTKHQYKKELSSITGIDTEALANPRSIHLFSVAQRMSWAAHRRTTRVEDVAYCLLGIFNVNIPLLYGEGSKAFIRLQEAIIHDIEDESLFAWVHPDVPGLNVDSYDTNHGILARHPIAFAKSFNITKCRSDLEPYAMTNRGLRMQVRFMQHRSEARGPKTHMSILNCREFSPDSELPESLLILHLDYEDGDGRYYKQTHRELLYIERSLIRLQDVDAKVIYIHK